MWLSLELRFWRAGVAAGVGILNSWGWGELGLELGFGGLGLEQGLGGVRPGVGIMVGSGWGWN